MSFCGIDLAVTRRTDVAVMRGYHVKVYEVVSDEEIISLCVNSKAVAIDSPLNSYYRDVEREMLRHGYKVLPPSFMKSLTERGIRLRSSMRVIETHPTSSLKNIGLNWRDLSEKKDIVDALVSAMTAKLYYQGKAEVISSHDGQIVVLPKTTFNIVKINGMEFMVFL